MKRAAYLVGDYNLSSVVVLMSNISYLDHRPDILSGFKRIIMLSADDIRTSLCIVCIDFFLISQPKFILWVLNRTVSMRRFF